MSPNDITGIHHIGLIVSDMDHALATFDRLGFNVGAPQYPALPPAPGRTPQPIGAGNTHADFPRSFIELVALAPDTRERLPAGAKLVPLSIPDEQLAATAAAIRGTVANLETRLDLGEGAHILVFASRDAEQTAERLELAKVGHGGARAVQRPIATADGTTLADIKYLEINDDDPDALVGLVAEGRVGAADNAPDELLDAQLGLRHPNGAIGLVDCVVSVDEDELESTIERYERYLGVAAEPEDSAAVFLLESSRAVVTTTRLFREMFPGEQPGSKPRISAYGVEVTNLWRTRQFLRARGVELRRCGDGRRFIPARDAHGAAIVLRQATSDIDAS